MVLHTEPQAQSERIRTAVETLQKAMQDYSSLMPKSTEQLIIKFGVVLAEARLYFIFSS
jgi:hypothetical protein